VIAIPIERALLAGERWRGRGERQDEPNNLGHFQPLFEAGMPPLASGTPDVVFHDAEASSPRMRVTTEGARLTVLAICCPRLVHEQTIQRRPIFGEHGPAFSEGSQKTAASPPKAQRCDRYRSSAVPSFRLARRSGECLGWSS